MLSSAVIALTLAASAFANVFITFPVATTVLTGGQSANVSWLDDGTAPSLSQFGKAEISIYVGNANQQTQLQLLSGSVDVATISSLQFTPDPSIGPNSGEYFIRVQSQSTQDPTNPKYPALAFSAKFTLTGMHGTFNSSLQAEIDGQSTAPIGPATTSVAATSAGSSTATTTPSSGQITPTTASTAPTSTSTSSTSGAAKCGIASLASFIGIAVALIGAAL